MKIDDEMFAPGADVYYSKEFYDTLESHMAYFRTASDTRSIVVEPHYADVYAGDLYGFLLYSGIAPKLHWLVMRVNNFFSPYEFGPEVTSLLIPRDGVVDSLRQSQKASGSAGAIAM